MSAALAALDGDHVGAEFHRLDGMLQRADRRHADDAGLLQSPDRAGVRAATVGDRANLVPDNGIKHLVGVGLEHVEVDPEGLLGPRLHVEDRFLDLAGLDGGAGQEAEAAGIAGRSRQLRVRHPAHGRLHHGIGAAQKVAKDGVKRPFHEVLPL